MVRSLITAFRSINTGEVVLVEAESAPEKWIFDGSPEVILERLGGKESTVSVPLSLPQYEDRIIKSQSIEYETLYSPDDIGMDHDQIISIIEYMRQRIGPMLEHDLVVVGVFFIRYDDLK